MKNHHSLPENFEVTVKKFDDGTFEQVTKFLNNNYANQFFSNYKTAYLGDRGIQFLSPEIANALKDNYFGKGLTLPMGMEEIENNTDNKGKKHINTWHEFNHQHGGIHLGIEENGGIFFNFDKNHKNLNGNLFSGFIEIKDKSTGEELVIVCDKGWFSCMSNTFSEKSNPIYKQWFEKRFESPSLLNEPIRDPNLYINFDIDKKTLSPQEEATFARYYSQRPNLVIQAAIDGIAKDNINVQKNKKADDTIGFKYTAPASTPRFFSLAVANDDFAKNIDYHIQTYAKQNGLKEKDIKTLKSKVQDVLKVSNELGKQIHFMVEDREDPNKIITILNKGANVNARDEHQQVPLHFAANAQNPDEQLIKTMLNKGANPNAQKSTGRTPLHFACKKVGTDKS
ncbi:MAG: ankyrin repeat domain-containing protein, partial [Sphingobacteriia bacterium]|nr:ankyrin repeat domain-containing protein [Sphingobacteriia bacterium]